MCFDMPWLPCIVVFAVFTGAPNLEQNDGDAHRAKPCETIFHSFFPSMFIAYKRINMPLWICALSTSDISIFDAPAAILGSPVFVQLGVPIKSNKLWVPNQSFYFGKLQCYRLSMQNCDSLGTPFTDTPSSTKVQRPQTWHGQVEKTLLPRVMLHGCWVH